MTKTEMKEKSERSIARAKEKFLNGTATDGDKFLLSIWILKDFELGGEKRKAVADYVKPLPQELKAEVSSWLSQWQNL